MVLTSVNTPSITYDERFLPFVSIFIRMCVRKYGRDHYLSDVFNEVTVW